MGDILFHNNKRGQEDFIRYSLHTHACAFNLCFSSHHKCYRTDIDKDHEERGALAGKSQVRSGTANFCMLWEVSDQRDSIIELLKLAQM